MTTEELVVLDQQAKEALNEIQRMSNMYVGIHILFKVQHHPDIQQ